MIIGINALSTQTQISKIIRKHCSARRGLSQYTKLFRFMLMKNCVTRLDQYFEFMVNTLHDPCGIVGLQYFRKFYWVPWKQQPSVPLSWAARMRSGTTGSAPAPSPIQQPGEILDLFREAECISQNRKILIIWITKNLRTQKRVNIWLLGHIIF